MHGAGPNRRLVTHDSPTVAIANRIACLADRVLVLNQRAAAEVEVLGMVDKLSTTAGS